MKSILLLGAGRSSSVLIKYLLDQSAENNWMVTVADVSESSAKNKTGGHPHARPIKFDVHDSAQREYEVQRADIVISLLPPNLHQLVAVDCVKHHKHFITASYITREMVALDDEAKKAGVLLLNECGLDPGIDHMSAMEVIHRLKAKGVTLNSFKSYTGGLVAPESNDNPWGYKFSWNPRNVILAGQGTARYIENNHYKYIPYRRLYSQIATIEVPGYGYFDGYANRDSLAYRHHYGIEKIPTLLRGTLRQQGYCKAWDIFIQLGLTDDSFVLENSATMTYSQMVAAFIPGSISTGSLPSDVAKLCNTPVDSEEMKLVTWTGIFDDEIIGVENATPAVVLQNLLEKKWLLKPGDKDMIVMQHQFGYNYNGKAQTLYSSLVVKGDDEVHTAMAKTVGLPLGIAAKLLLENKIIARGVVIPVTPEIYEPILENLKKAGIEFKEHEQ